MSKLTLNVDDELIAAAKQEAAARNTSVSKLVSELFSHFQGNRKQGKEELPPITSSLLGCLQDSSATHDDYIDYLEDKHS